MTFYNAQYHNNSLQVPPSENVGHFQEGNLYKIQILNSTFGHPPSRTSMHQIVLKKEFIFTVSLRHFVKI